MLSPADRDEAWRRLRELDRGHGRRTPYMLLAEKHLLAVAEALEADEQWYQHPFASGDRSFTAVQIRRQKALDALLADVLEIEE